jgi:hypothetical protein
VGVAVLGLTLLSSLACASEYCTKGQYERDHALIADAFSNGTLVNGPKGLRDSILVQEDQWFAMNYPKQIAFMQSFECAMAGASGKQLLYMDVRSLARGNLLATWTLGVLKPAQVPPGREASLGTPRIGASPGTHDVTNPGMSEGSPRMSEGNSGMSEVMGDENRIGLTGEYRAAFIQVTIDECNKSSNSAPPTYCGCYANALADSVSIKELKEGMTALLIAAAGKHCRSNYTPRTLGVCAPPSPLSWPPLRLSDQLTRY